MSTRISITDHETHPDGSLTAIASIPAKGDLKVAHRPVTMGHPHTPITADHWDDVVKGWSEKEVSREGDAARVALLVKDPAAVGALLAGTHSLHLGGTDDRATHLAILEHPPVRGTNGPERAQSAGGA